jgi:hypothetical protein
VLALTSIAPEQEAAAAPAAAAASASAPALAHDSTACQHQAPVVGRMWGMVADTPKMQQHLVSHLNRAEADLARTQASHQNGSAQPMSILSQVHDTWGNSLARKKSLSVTCLVSMSEIGSTEIALLVCEQSTDYPHYATDILVSKTPQQCCLAVRLSSCVGFSYNSTGSS